MTRVGFGAQTTDGVVSYKTILRVNNDDLTLRPGMTATAEIMTATRENALLIPNAALRFSPEANGQKKSSGGLVGTLLPRPPTQPKQKKAKNGTSPHVWILRDSLPVELPITTGLTDGRFTEVLQGELQAGMAVITDYQEAKK